MPGINLTRAEAFARSATIHTHSYDIDLDLTATGDVFRSVTVVRFDATEGASTFLDLIAPKVHEVVLNGETLDPQLVHRDSRIHLDHLSATNEVRIVADCSYMHTGEGLHRFIDPVDGETYLYSQFEVADSRRVFAVADQPDLKATYAFTVTAPTHWQVITNDPVAEVREVDGGKTWTFQTTPRLSSYITAIVAGPYHREDFEITSVDGRIIPAGVYCRESLAPFLDAKNIVDIAAAGMAFYENAFGVPYPFAKYDQLFVPDFNAGAMENAGCVTFLENYVFRSKPTDAFVERRAITILHELAHMWFGDLVTMKWWDDLWLNESFAEFMAALAAANTDYPEAWTTFSLMEKSWAYRQDQLASTHPIVADMRDLEDVEVNFDGITYAKGASVLRQLVAWVGQDQFMAGVGSYLRKNAWGNATLADFLSELEVASGRDLSGWSKLWLEQAGVTLLEPEFTVAEDGTFATFAIRQQVPAEYPVQRPHRLVIGGYDLVPGSLQRVLAHELDIDGELTPVPALIGTRRPDLILLNDEDLAYAKVRLDADSLQVATEHLSDFTQSLPRTLIWGAAWDMARDADMPAREYVRLVLKNIGNETDSSVLMMVLRQLATTLDHYVAPDARAATCLEAEQALLRLAQEAKPGSDAQLQFYKTLALRAATAETLDEIEAILAGKAIPGLELDPDLRWEFVAAMTAGGRWGEAEVEREHAADATANGLRAAALARAAIATPEAKATAWAQAVAGNELPNTIQRNVLTGFARTHDHGLLEPYVERYFESALAVWGAKTNEMAQNVIVISFPMALASQSLLARIDTWIEAHGESAPNGLVRLMREHRDGVTRALRAQAADV